ncbi:MAG TPA: GNAT family N-acetyltransferase [Gammaproteobacteria bacterium]|nr:GNAT family N-acetyltransferase [Gammaproteobacteria bacterium]
MAPILCFICFSSHRLYFIILEVSTIAELFQTAVYGSVRTMVWEGGVSDGSSHPMLLLMEGKLFDIYVDEKLLPVEELLPLWERTTARDVFNHPEWLHVVGNIFPEARKICLRVMVAEEMIAYWPFQIRCGGVKELWANLIEPVGSSKSDYITPLINKEYGTDEILGLMFTKLSQFLNFHTILHVPKTTFNDAEIDSLSHLFSVDGLFHLAEKNSCPRMFFTGTYDETIKAWSSSLRGDVRRQMRRLGEQGVLTIKVYEGFVADRLSVLEKMHLNEWGSKGMPSEFSDPCELEFYRGAVQALPFNMVHYSEVLLDGEPISCHLGFISNSWLYWYKPTYNMDYQVFSPGKVHLALLSKWGIENGLIGIDFLQGAEAYKNLWANDGKLTNSLIAASSSAILFWLWQTQWREKVRDIFLRMRTNIKRKFG